MENKNDLYIGPKSRPRTCPVCMRTKEDAIAGQLQSGKSCGHERCEFKSEMELVFAILNAPDIERIKSLTCESIETSKKTYELLVSLRESVRAMKTDPGSENSNDAGKTVKIHPQSFNDSTDMEYRSTDEQLRSIYDRIDHSTRTLSKWIEMKDNSQSVNPINQNSKDYKAEKRNNDWQEYLKSREEFNRKMNEAWAKVHNSLKGMHEVVEEMKEELKEESERKNDVAI